MALNFQLVSAFGYHNTSLDLATSLGRLFEGKATDLQPRFVYSVSPNRVHTFEAIWEKMRFVSLKWDSSPI